MREFPKDDLLKLLFLIQNLYSGAVFGEEIIG